MHIHVIDEYCILETTAGISILYRKPIKQPPNLFSFLSPLSLDVWIYMATAYLGVSVLLYILARYNACNTFSLLLLLFINVIRKNSILDWSTVCIIITSGVATISEKRGGVNKKPYTN